MNLKNLTDAQIKILIKLGIIKKIRCSYAQMNAEKYKYYRFILN